MNRALVDGQGLGDSLSRDEGIRFRGFSKLDWLLRLFLMRDVFHALLFIRNFLKTKPACGPFLLIVKIPQILRLGGRRGETLTV